MGFKYHGNLTPTIIPLKIHEYQKKKYMNISYEYGHKNPLKN